MTFSFSCRDATLEKSGMLSVVNTKTNIFVGVATESYSNRRRTRPSRQTSATAPSA